MVLQREAWRASGGTRVWKNLSCPGEEECEAVPPLLIIRLGFGVRGAGKQQLVDSVRGAPCRVAGKTFSDGYWHPYKLSPVCQCGSYIFWVFHVH